MPVELRVDRVDHRLAGGFPARGAGGRGECAEREDGGGDHRRRSPAGSADLAQVAVAPVQHAGSILAVPGRRLLVHLQQPTATIPSAAPPAPKILGRKTSAPLRAVSLTVKLLGTRRSRFSSPRVECA